jgi:hypothetical protein
VVLYDAAYQLDLRIFTIPVEDFFYGSSLILGCTTVYEKNPERSWLNRSQSSAADYPA